MYGTFKIFLLFPASAAKYTSDLSFKLNRNNYVHKPQVRQYNSLHVFSNTVWENSRKLSSPCSLSMFHSWYYNV